MIPAFRFLVTCCEFLSDFVFGFFEARLDINRDYYVILEKLLYIFAPLTTAVILYQYVKHSLIFNASLYEASVKKRYGYFRKLSKQLKILIKRYGNFYFRYMPMNHGTTLPQTQTLFAAIKEVLLNANKPATRGVRTNLLFELIQGSSGDSRKNFANMEIALRSDYDGVLEDSDSLSEYNLDIFKCSREMIIQGIKDFDVMTTVFRVLETVMEDEEND